MRFNSLTYSISMTMKKTLKIDADEDGYALDENRELANLPNTPDDYEDDEYLSFEERYRRTTQWGGKHLYRTPVPKLIQHLYLGWTLKSDWIEPDVLVTKPLEEWGLFSMPDYLIDYQVDADRPEVFMDLTVKYK